MNLDKLHTISLTLMKVAVEGPPTQEDLLEGTPGTAPATLPPPAASAPDQTQLKAESKRLSDAMLKGEAFTPDFTKDWADKDKWLGSEQNSIVNKWFNPVDDAGKPRSLNPGEAAALQARMERLAVEKDQPILGGRGTIAASPYAATKFQLEGEDFKGRQFTPAEIVKERMAGLAGGFQKDPAQAAAYQKALEDERVKQFAPELAMVAKGVDAAKGALPDAVASPDPAALPALTSAVTKAIANKEAEAAAAGIKQIQTTVDEATKNNPTGVTDWLTKNWETLLVPGGLLLAAFGGNSMTTMVGLAAAAYGGYNLYGRYNYLQSKPGSAVMQMALKDAAAGKTGSPETLAQLKAMGPQAEAAYHDALFAIKFGYVQDMVKDEAYTQGTQLYNNLNQKSEAMLQQQLAAQGVMNNEDRRKAQAVPPAAPKP
jgi:hypothetical protein